MIEMMYVEGSLLSWVVQVLNIPENYLEATFEDNIPENMPPFSKGYSWFGIFGMSSKVLENNMDNFSNIVFLLIKLLAAKLIGRCLSKKFKKVLKIETSFQ